MIFQQICYFTITRMITDIIRADYKTSPTAFSDKSEGRGREECMHVWRHYITYLGAIHKWHQQNFGSFYSPLVCIRNWFIFGTDLDYNSTRHPLFITSAFPWNTSSADVTCGWSHIGKPTIATESSQVKWVTNREPISILSFLRVLCS